jgi:hypothetical protein
MNANQIAKQMNINQTADNQIAKQFVANF